MFHIYFTPNTNLLSIQDRLHQCTVLKKIYQWFFSIDFSIYSFVQHITILESFLKTTQHKTLKNCINYNYLFILISNLFIVYTICSYTSYSATRTHIMVCYFFQKLFDLMMGLKHNLSSNAGFETFTGAWNDAQLQ